MINRLIKATLAIVLCLAGCVSPEKEIAEKPTLQQPAKVEAALPAPAPTQANDFAYSYAEEPEVIICQGTTNTIIQIAEDFEMPGTLPDIDTEPIDEDNIVNVNEDLDLYDYVAQQNTTTQKINGLFGGSITGKQGTTLYIPREAFETLDSVQVDGWVNVTIEEYFNKSDFILAGLSSMSGDKLIESSGMFNIKATTADGKEVRLKKGKTIRLALPKNKRALKNTQIFYGEKAHLDNNAPANWQVAGYNLQSQKKSQPKAWRKLESRIEFFVAPKLKASQYYKKTMPNVPSLAVMEPNTKNKTEKNILKYFDGRHRYDQFVRSVFYKKKLQEAVSSMEDLDTLRVIFEIDPKGKLLSADVQSATMDKDNLQKVKDAFVMKKVFKMNTLHKKQERYTLFMVKNTPIGYDSYRESFPIDKMGWINCDRFLGGNEPLIAMKVEEPYSTKTTFYCVFNNINSIMPGYTNSGYFFFPNVPVGANVTVVGIKTDANKKTYLSIGTTIVAANYAPKTFEEISPAELKQKLMVAFGETPNPAQVTMAKP